MISACTCPAGFVYQIIFPILVVLYTDLLKLYTCRAPANNQGGQEIISHQTKDLSRLKLPGTMADRCRYS